MNRFPDNIFTEPEDVSPDTLANLGPLHRMAGVWEGSKGTDFNPKAEGPERREYIERLALQPIDAQANGPQLFYGLRYAVQILATDEQATFHDQVGYWLWEPATELVLQTVAIPRGQVAIASGQAAPDASSLVLSAKRADGIWHLLHRVPGIRIPHRFIRHRGQFQCRWELELCLRHHAGGARTFRTIPLPGPQHSAESGRTHSQSAVPEVQALMRLDGAE